MPPRKSTRIVGKTSADASVSAKLGPKKRKLKSSKKPIVFYFAYGDTRLDLAKGYYPLYLGRDPLLQPVVYELAEEADATLHIESDDQTPADLVSAVPNVFSELPTELLVEILLLLGPRDLLYLTRATKYLRKLLSSDSDNVANIWKEVCALDLFVLFGSG
ncbi:hypothetical protein CPB83DRAFT_91202 [Crepidotus variabilis]|uniref:F-box domain-containing protein n=1 Tax=Crepidotus variabilis TaxID=179855 RepID=A0A9P6E529_9AGAR|nr:hypothetical protein CPB83DRAFT_91202 [Crepidotus variabilis]